MHPTPSQETPNSDFASSSKSSASPAPSVSNSPSASSFKFFNYVTIAIYWFSLSFLWGGFLSVVLPALNKPVAESLFGQGKAEVARGIMTSLGLIIAMLVQPLSGAISDRSSHPMGRRRPFMLGGTVVGLLALAVIAFSGSWWILLLGYILLQFGDNLSQGAYQGLMPDVVPSDKRGKASAALGIAQLVGTLFGATVPGFLQAGFGEVRGSQIDLLLVGIVFIISLTITVLFVREKPYVPTAKVAAWKTAVSMFQGVSHYPDFIKLMLARFIFLSAPASVSLFVKSFLESPDRRFVAHKVATTSAPCLDANNQPLAIPNGQPCLDSSGHLIFQAGSTLSLILGLVLIAAIVGSYPASALSDKFGRKAVLYTMASIGIVGGLLLLIPNFIMAGAVANSANMNLAQQEAYLNTYRPTAITLTVIFGALIGISWGGFLGVDWAFATDLIPLSEAGRFMGLSNLATAGCQAFAAFVGGFVVDSAIGYTGLFFLVAIYYFVSAVILFRVRETRGRKAQPLLQVEPAS